MLVPELLLVEDDRAVRRAAARACRSEGLGVEEVVDVDGACERLAERSFQLVLVDLMLPGRSGFDLLERLATDPAAPPAIMITGYATLDNALKSFRLGSFDFIPKPFDVGELLGVVHRGLWWQRRGRDLWRSREQAEVGDRHFLGRHAWARLDEDGVATIGAAETFGGLQEDIQRVELPDPGELLLQCRSAARIRDASLFAYRVWSPLSGRVVAVNQRVTEDPLLAVRDPFGDGWLLQLIPAHFEDELSELGRCRPDDP
jgi:DNA-binding response OmpR family regulator